MRVEPIQSIEQLKALLPDWCELVERATPATPFQFPEWLLPWWDEFGSGEIFSFAAYSDGRLVGLAPMFLHLWQGRRQVTFLGNGVSDHLDFILDPAFRDRAAQAILEQMKRERLRWDVCDLQDLPGDSPLAACGAVAQYTCMRIPLPADVEQFRAALPHGLRRNLRRYRDQLGTQGEVALETVTEDFPGALRALIELHRARWASKHDAGMINGPGMERFHSRAAKELHGRGIARLHVLRVDGVIRAVVYAMVNRRHACSYLGGFDPELARFSPGALILNFAIEQSIREGARVYDFLRGDEAYKLDWGAERYVSYRLELREAAAA